MIKHLLAFVALCMFGYCNAQSAFTIQCDLSGVLYSAPDTPGPSDHIALYARWYPFCSSFFCQRLPNALGGVATVAGSIIFLDVYGSDQPINIVGAQLVANQFQDWYGTVGPLSPGMYTLTTRFHAIDASGTVTDACPPQDTAFVVSQQSGATVVATAIEYYYPALDHYFITDNPIEIAALDNGVIRGWSRTGFSFKVYAPLNSDGRGVPVSRFYGLPSAGLDSHFFTANEDETYYLVTQLSGVWLLESRNVFELGLPHSVTGACLAGTVPVFRLWDARSDSDHRFTTDPAVRDQMLARGYVQEGWGAQPVAMCAPQ